VSAAEHLLELITSLLDLVKIGAGTLKPVSAVSTSRSMFRNGSDAQPLAEKKGLH
jgi:signal transduction histidine kinase